MKKLWGDTNKMLEFYYFLVLAFAIVLFIGGIATKRGEFLALAGIFFVIAGLVPQTEGIEREINYQIIRNEFDDNRVKDLNISSQLLFASNSNEAPSAGTKNDKGLWMLAQVFLYGGF